MRVQLIITLDERGQIQVQGPIADKMTCYGLLDLAKEAIKEHCDQLARVQIATPEQVRDISRDKHVAFDQPLRAV